MPNHIMTGFGTPDGQYSWISKNVEEILGLTAEQIREHRLTIVPVSPNARYAQILAEEKQRHGPRLTFRSWQIRVQNNRQTIPLAVIALFLRDHDGELDKIVGAAWNLGFCLIFPCPAQQLCQATIELAHIAAASL